MTTGLVERAGQEVRRVGDCTCHLLDVVVSPGKLSVANPPERTIAHEIQRSSQAADASFTVGR